MFMVRSGGMNIIIYLQGSTGMTLCGEKKVDSFGFVAMVIDLPVFLTRIGPAVIEALFSHLAPRCMG